MNKFIAKVYGGSRLYGLENENSDTDIKGIFLPELNDLILEKASKNIRAKDESLNIEYESFSLQSFLANAINNEDVAIVMLHASDNKVLLDSDIYKFLRQNRKKFYTKRMVGQLGFAKSQAMKYSLRAERMIAVKLAIDKLDELINRGVLKLCQAWDELPTDGKYLIKTEEIKSREGDKRVWEVSGKGCTANVNPIYCRDFLGKLYDNYGDRVKVAASLDSHDLKSISHAFRVAYQLKNIYTYGDFSFPLPESEFIKKVKTGKVDFLKEKIDDQLNELIGQVELMAENSTYPKSVDTNFVDDIVLNAYGLKTGWKS